MAQCGGIGVGELNKLEVDRCERLRWRLLPTVKDMGELLEAIHNPHAAFWNGWYNARSTQPIAPTPATSSISGLESRSQPGTVAAAAPPQKQTSQPQQQQQTQAQTNTPRMPHAKSVGDSLARLFRGGASEGNLEAMGAAHAAASGAGLSMGPGKQQHEGLADVHGVRSNTSPRSVMGKTFSFSNLFGLATGW